MFSKALLVLLLKDPRRIGHPLKALATFSLTTRLLGWVVAPYVRVLSTNRPQFGPYPEMRSGQHLKISARSGMKAFPEHGAILPLESTRESLMKPVALETCLPEVER
jgi:hypothetical protein